MSADEQVCGPDPALTRRAEEAARDADGVVAVERVRLRWVGHRLHGDAVVTTRMTTLAESACVRAEIQAGARERLPHLEEFAVEVLPATP